jgi:hypothetical protein
VEISQEVLRGDPALRRGNQALPPPALPERSESRDPSMDAPGEGRACPGRPGPRLDVAQPQPPLQATVFTKGALQRTPSTRAPLWQMPQHSQDFPQPAQSKEILNLCQKEGSPACRLGSARARVGPWQRGQGGTVRTALIIQRQATRTPRQEGSHPGTLPGRAFGFLPQKAIQQRRARVDRVLEQDVRRRT